MPSPHAPVVRVRGLAKRFGDLEVLRALDLDVAPAEVLALVGPSGSGKSTLLRCLDGLEPFDEGSLDVLGVAVPAGDLGPVAHEAFWRPLRRRIGFVFQAFHLYPHLTALRNVATAPVVVAGLERGAAEERAQRLLASVGLADKVGAFPRELSGGQRQRVAIARALAMEPEVLLLDEPTSALDPGTTGEVLDVLRALAAEHRRTIVVVTHEIAFAREAADRVGVLVEGRVVEIGPARDVLDRPTDARTRAFLSRLSPVAAPKGP